MKANKQKSTKTKQTNNQKQKAGESYVFFAL